MESETVTQKPPGPAIGQPNWKTYLIEVAKRNEEILRQLAAGVPPKCIAMDFDISETRVCQIRRGWNHRKT
jgi:FixJ family two-component response regulator